MKKIKFAILGFGNIGKRHGVIVNNHHASELVGIIDSNKNAADHELYPSGIPFFTSLDEFFKAGIEVDVINIATPNGLHCQHALEILNNGHHCVIEKPMGLSKRECEDVIFKSLQVSKQVFVVKQNRYSPPSRWLKKVVDEGLLGNIQTVQINCYWNRDDRYYNKADWKGSLQMDGGTLFTQFSHFLDIMYWLFGDIHQIKGIFADFNHQENTEFEDTGLVHFQFVKGGIGCINFSTAVWNQNMESSITITGSKGSLKVGGQYMNEIEYCDIENYEVPELEPTNPPNDYGPFTGSAANHHFVIENVVKTLHGNDIITANALEGMKVVDIIERIYESGERPLKKPERVSVESLNR